MHVVVSKLHSFRHTYENGAAWVVRADYKEDNHTNVKHGQECILLGAFIDTEI